jgi:hypothetical protein
MVDFSFLTGLMAEILRYGLIAILNGNLSVPGGIKLIEPRLFIRFRIDFRTWAAETWSLDRLYLSRSAPSLI